MLVLSRKIGEKIVIGDGIEIAVVEIKGRQVRLGISAPKGVKIWREELVKEPTTVVARERELCHA
jgi:carbon storage regulator